MILESVNNITTADPANLRHEKEYARLQTRLDRESQNWDGNHPRHRLLTALYGFSRYKERHVAEVNRWRSLYKKMSKNQRVVCFILTDRSSEHGDANGNRSSNRLSSTPIS